MKGYIQKGDLSSELVDTYMTTNANNDYSVVIPNIYSYTDGLPVCIKFNDASTGAATLNINNLGKVNIIDYFGNPVGNIRKNLITNLRYESTASSFILLGKGGGGNATASQLLTGATATVDSGQIDGSMLDHSNEELSANNEMLLDDGSGNMLYLKVPQGYYNGRTDGIWDSKSNIHSTHQPDLKAANIVSGKSIFGVSGSATIEPSRAAGNNIIFALPEALSSICDGNSTYNYYIYSNGIIQNFTINFNGSVRINYGIAALSGYGNCGTVHFQIYKNNIAVGILRTISVNNGVFVPSYNYYSEDFSCSKGDIFIFWYSSDAPSLCMSQVSFSVDNPLITAKQ